MSKKSDLLASLRGLSIFAHCTDDELAEIDRMADEVHVASGRTLVRQGEVGHEFVVIMQGRATVERDGVGIAQLGPGDHFGELALLDEHLRNASVVAESELTVQVVDRRAFSTLLEDSPHLATNLLRSLARRLSEVDEENAALRARLES